MSRGPASTAGLTLVEVTFAMAVLALVLVGVFSTVSVAQRATTYTKERQAASESAFEQLDLMMATPFNAMVDGGFHVTLDTGRGTTTNMRPAAPTFFSPGADDTSMAGHIRIVPLAAGDPQGDGTSDLAEVRITVAWRAADDTNQRLDVVTRRSGW